MLIAYQGSEGVRIDVQVPSKCSISNLLDVQVFLHEKSMGYLESGEFSGSAPNLETLNHGKVGQQGMITAPSARPTTPPPWRKQPLAPCDIQGGDKSA